MTRHSGSQAEASELWFSWGEWNCGIYIPEGWQGVQVLWVLLMVPLMEGTTSLGSLPLGGTLTLGQKLLLSPCSDHTGGYFDMSRFGGHWVGPDPSLTVNSL